MKMKKKKSVWDSLGVSVVSVTYVLPKNKKLKKGAIKRINDALVDYAEFLIKKYEKKGSG